MPLINPFFFFLMYTCEIFYILLAKAIKKQGGRTLHNGLVLVLKCKTKLDLGMKLLWSQVSNVCHVHYAKSPLYNYNVSHTKIREERRGTCKDGGNI